ncbi:nicotinate phosphoribosyltransferase [Mucilaginibacter robiniae]|uniref:Nicotinamide phosphoribosyltransferase n=1 Tax=Mucilaginibacter robiniae TaxID=2728022 RepID=A0A7L5E5W8_9SPHI|nr:nicotinate phosphoribosyltransferase [Mucilaginibacter robiniae]QJD97787.1 nicotinate phosphoribosyltransferase [Mucilaginibacter robiniae]
MKNILLQTDVYKMGHVEQYAPGCNKVYSYLTARSEKVFPETVLFGLQYYIKRYLIQPITPEMGEEFLNYRRLILGSNSPEIEAKIRELCQLGYLPIEIKAVKEGTIMPVKNVLMTITNTHPDFFWVVGFIESLLLKLWYTITVATCSYQYRKVVNRFFEATDDDALQALKDFQVHDFGYRGDSSEEGAAISGVAHLLSFLGSDNVPALPCAIEFYNADVNGESIMLSVPASEHSVMCSFGREDEIEAFQHMIDLYPAGIVSIVSDTFDVYKVLTDFAERLKPSILQREGKVVFRPDSGNPESIICGDPDAETGSNEWKGAIRLLDEKFGSSVNTKGYKVLNPKVGLIYGDGMYMERYIRILERLQKMGYAASNLVIGVGGILRNHSRDTLGFAIKATYVEVNGEPREIEKDPITDHKKKSHKGLLALVKNEQGYQTLDRCTPEQEANSLLKTVFKNGKIVSETNLANIRQWLKEQEAEVNNKVSV